MAFARTGPLRHELESLFPHRPFSLRFWDDSVVRATEPGAPTFTFHSPLARAHVLRAPGELGLGRAYVTGLLDVDDLDAALLVVDAFEPPSLSPAQGARLAVAVMRASGLVVPPRPPNTELRLRGERHTLIRDRRAVQHHYDVGNEFFQLFLDRSMTYSCAYFSGGADPLEEAQEAKLELVCRKLGLRDGERVLDVGCGWASLAIHAASRHGARVLGVTLAEQQAQLARERVRAAGLTDRIEIRLADYREVMDGPFDAISSIGMVEHVGREKIDVYAAQLGALLRPGGRLLNHGIARLGPGKEERGGAFSERFVFPDGAPVHVSHVMAALETAGFVPGHVEGFAEDYSRTLREWARRLDEHGNEAERIAGPERLRVWRLYLRAARHGFDTGFTSVYQVLARLS